MTMLSPAMIGDDKPLGILTFHFTFLLGPNRTGGFCPSATPDPPGPRNCGQASGSPARPTAANNPNATNAIIVLMSISLVVDRISHRPRARRRLHDDQRARRTRRRRRSLPLRSRTRGRNVLGSFPRRSPTLTQPTAVG